MQIPQWLVDTGKRWQLTDAALLFLTGHRPLAFAIGQGLHLLAPVAALAGIDTLDELGSLLSRSDGTAILHDVLTTKKMTTKKKGNSSALQESIEESTTEESTTN